MPHVSPMLLCQGQLWHACEAPPGDQDLQLRDLLQSFQCQVLPQVSHDEEAQGMVGGVGFAFGIIWKLYRVMDLIEIYQGW